MHCLGQGALEGVAFPLQLVELFECLLKGRGYDGCLK